MGDTGSLALGATLATIAIITKHELTFILVSGVFIFETLVKYGANFGPLVKDGEVYRLVSYMFLHAGIIHIFFNMYSLYIVGPRVEDFYGKWKFLLIYLQ